MLESEIHKEYDDRENYRCNQNQNGRTLQFAPSRPGNFLGELLIGLLQIVNELSHLSS